MRQRIDVLLYSHDGRGQGHLSRTVAIGLALRRLAPRLRLMIVTGSSFASALIAEAGLDWFKLPAYRTAIRGGKSKPRTGASGLAHTAIVEVRRRLLGDVVTHLRPRCILVDHLARGKEGELDLALKNSRRLGTRCVLGIRAVPGTARRAMVRRFRGRGQRLLHSRSLVWRTLSPRHRYS